LKAGSFSVPKTNQKAKRRVATVCQVDSGVVFQTQILLNKLVKLKERRRRVSYKLKEESSFP
jgi:hypothetical protein